MITEDYVPFEVAELLKEKGFDEPCRTYYQDEKFVDDVCTQYYQWNSKSPFGHISAPTLQLAMKWLREVFELYIEIGYDDLDWYWNILSISEEIRVLDRPKIIKIGTACHRTYGKAVEAAIKYCLENLI